MLRCLLIILFFVISALPLRAQETVVEYAAASQTAASGVFSYKLDLDARLTEKGESITRGMVWRVFQDQTGEDGKLPLIATAKGGRATFSLPAGTYLIHAAFGRAGATKRVALGSDGASENFVLQAGGLELHAETGGKGIPPRALRFSIYERDQNEAGERKLIALNATANRIIRLNSGTYHVLSRYGTINATVRADLEVKAGEVTRATLQHRAAAISLRLVSKPGGDPIANTAWSIFTEDGDSVFSSSSASPSLILAEGTYEASVRNGAREYRQPFTVAAGKNIRVEILLTD